MPNCGHDSPADLSKINIKRLYEIAALLLSRVTVGLASAFDDYPSASGNDRDGTESDYDGVTTRVS